MVQSLQSNSMAGSILRVGETQNGRAVYQISGADGTVAGMVTLPQQQCDTFEKAFNDINEAAPKLEEYMSHQTKESMKRTQKKARWALILSTLSGFAIPALLLKGKLKPFLEWTIATAGAITGFFTGSFIGRAIATPPGAKKVAKASETISKLDIQPLQA